MSVPSRFVDPNTLNSWKLESCHLADIGSLEAPLCQVWLNLSLDVGGRNASRPRSPLLLMSARITSQGILLVRGRVWSGCYGLTAIATHRGLFERDSLERTASRIVDVETVLKVDLAYIPFGYPALLAHVF